MTPYLPQYVREALQAKEDQLDCHESVSHIQSSEFEVAQ